MQKLIEKLRKRAESFYKLGLECYTNEDFDLAMFNLEQAAQLFLKSKILEFGIQFPKIHEISKLLEFLEDKAEKVKEIKEKFKEEIEILEEAYISSRYFLTSFSKEDVERVLKFLEELWKLQ